MRLSLVEVTGDTEPLTEAELAAHLRLEEGGPEADALVRMISSAREAFEDETGRQVLEATWKLLLPGFPRVRSESIEIPRPPLRSVTTVQYLDTSGTLQTWDSDEWEAHTPAGPFARPGWIRPKPTHSWPLASRDDGSVRITFTAGYETVPESLRETLLHVAAGFYEFREPQVVGSIVTASPSFDRLMSRWRLPVMA